MTGFSDRLVILKIGDGAGSETFAAIAGLRDVTISENSEEVDTTSKDDSGYRTLLAARSLHSITVTGTGVFKDSDTIADLKTDMRAGTLRNFQIDVASASATTAGEVITAAFKITQFEIAAPNAGEINYTISLASSGTITIS